MMLAQDRKDHRSTYGYGQRYNLKYNHDTTEPMFHLVYMKPPGLRVVLVYIAGKKDMAADAAACWVSWIRVL